MKTLTLLFVLVLGVVLQASPVHALVSYSVSPLVVDEEVEERDIIEHTITLKNTGDTPVTIYPTVNNISLGDGGEIQEFVTQVMSDQTRSLAAWIDISRAGIDLLSGQTKTVTLLLRINPSAVPGEYHALVGFPHGGNRDEAERMLARGDAPGTIVTVSVVDKKTTLLKLGRFLVDKFVTSEKNSGASYTVRNPGDEPLIPKGEVIFYDAKGKEVGSLPVNTENIEIPPGGEHTFVGAVPTEGLFGKYKAFLSLEYGKGTVASVQDTAFFYVVPLTTLLGIFAVFAILVIIISIYVHRKYFDDAVDDGSELLPVHVRETNSDPLHHDIDLRKP
jgi:hypothetical protein